ncbi:MAG TPA: hypothetical protein VFA81_04740 [Burkholderiales bacterium]|nr:hypothetical protein [Burkholderiales bacterium]
MTRRDLFGFALLIATAALTLAIYWPALSGPFLFDDTLNLDDLAAVGGVTDWPSFALWVLGGTAGPLGRPIALASFLVNDNAWPSDAWSFKYTNLMLHLAAGLLAFWFLAELSQRLGSEQARRRGRIAAALAACIWLIHPMQVATVMFVIQRMTILGTAFMLAGGTMWLKGARIAATHPIKGSSLMLAGLGGFGSLAILSKETGALLPCYLAVIACCMPVIDMRSPMLRRMHWLTLLAPPLLAIAYFTVEHRSLADAFVIREFTPLQRVMTEPMILWGYARDLLVPDLRIGLYFDDLTAARSLIDPPWAGLALIGWIAAVVLAVRWRRQQPVASLAILWFLIGHSLEAGPFSLELAFLHRNYLPMIGPLFAGAFYLLGTERRLLAGAAGAAFGGACVLITAINAITWGNEGLLLNTWAEQRPASQRAQQAAASFWLRNGDVSKSLEFLDRAVVANPRSPALHIQRFYLRCIHQQPQMESWNAILQMLPSADLDTSTSESLTLLITEIASGRCGELKHADVRAAAESLLHNPRYRSARWQRSLQMAIGDTYVVERNLNEAMAHLDRAYAALPAVQIAKAQAAILASAGLYADAIEYLERERATPPSTLGERIYFEARLRPALSREIDELRRKLRAGSIEH